MIDVTIVDQLFELGRETGVPTGFHIFDHSVLLPLSQLPEAIEAEVGLTVTVDELRSRARDGWFPLLARDDDEPGTPLYVPSRVGLFVALENAGWTPEEIRQCADAEESLIACVLTTGEFMYDDDDLRFLIRHTRSMIESLEHSSSLVNGEPADRGSDLAQQRKYLAFFEGLARKGIPATLEPKVAKHAFRVRAWNEAVRLQMVEQDRAQLRQGFSPTVHFRRWSRKEFEHTFEEIMWEATLRSAMAHDESADGPLIRVPGFILRGDRVSPSKTLRPVEYEQLWSQHDLDRYLMAWANVRGERCCANCLEPLPSEASDLRRFCGERCRNAAKQRRFRERNPEAAERARRRYYKSIEDDE